MRQEIITQLRRHLKAVLSRRPGRALWLWGEPGVGKTFTAQTLLRETSCKSLSLHATLPDRALVLSLPRPPRRPAWSEAQRQRLMHSQYVPLATLVDTLAATMSALAPFVLHLEDLHEASPERLELVQKLAQVVLRLRGVGLVVTSRSEPLEPFKGYRLEPLSQAESDQLLRAEAAHELPQEGLEWVFSRAKGNPLFTLEFWRYLSRQGYFWSDGRHWHWRKPSDDFVPVSVEALIGRVLSDLVEAPDLQAALEARAILPSRLHDDAFEALWSRVADVDSQTLSHIQRLLNQKGVLQQGRFAHPLIQEVLQREIPAWRKQAYARRALVALAGQPEEAACFIEMAHLEPEEALGLLEAAAQSAEARGNRPGQARWLAEAVKYSSSLEQAGRAFEAAQLLKAMNPTRAIQMAEIAASATLPNPEAVLLLAELLAVQGHIREAEASLRRLPRSEDGALRWWETQIYVLGQGGRWQQAIELWNQQPGYQARARPRIRLEVGSCLAFLNKLDEAQHILEELPSLHSLPPAIQLAVLNLQGQIQTYRGCHAQALKSEERFIALAKSMGSAQAAISGLINHASTHSALGLRSQAKACLQEARILSLQSGETMRHAVVQLRLADMLADEGEFEQAEALLLEAQGLLYQHHQVQWQAESHLKLARLYLTWQPPHGPILALKHAQSALRLARASRDVKFLASSLAYLSRAHSQAGNPAAALEVAQECLALCTGEGIKQADAYFAYGLALEANGRLAEALEAIRAASAQQHERKLAERFALEADRISANLEDARKRYEWFVSQGLLGLARLASRYFPVLAGPSQARHESPLQSGLCLKVLGPVELEQGGQPITYRGKKRLELLCYLLEARIAGRAEVSGLELADALYPAAEEVRARATLKQQVHLIRMTLGPEAIQSTPSGYALGAIRSDAEEFLQRGDARLWRGPYLEHLCEGWHGGVREALTQALYAEAGALLESEPKEASRLAQILLAMEPYDTGFLQLSLQAVRRCGSPKAATRLYKEAQERFLEVGEVLPGLEAFLQTAPPA
ncbi:AAA family ATPase [Calidithermus roseus]|uniref:AAA ATPase domain protein n=1 Tax=Calidithermus roseus TaxID=1644118 RepID=A0A399F1M5_9DEIN|nr:AAA family ATPase [Calidithermus roseus]RIH89596.1 AAA ATPase domain protein [Calidithermus roseus]